MRRSRKKPSPAEKVAHDRFRVEVLAFRPCWLSATREGHICEGGLDPHHVLPAQVLKNALRGRIASGLLALTDEEFWLRVHDPANGLPICRGSHDLITVKAERIYWDELPPRVVENAYSLGLEERLEIECPKRSVQPTQAEEDLF